MKKTLLARNYNAIHLIGCCLGTLMVSNGHFFGGLIVMAFVYALGSCLSYIVKD